MADSNKSNFLIAEAQLILDEARKIKSEKIKSLGSPIQLAGKALSIQIHGSNAWIAENTAVGKKIDLESGKTLQIYRGHTGPVTTLAFCDKASGSNDGVILITGSWDQTIKLWNTTTKELISSTDAHSDFLKCLFVIPSLRLLVSGSSDKVVRFWDLSSASERKPLTSLGSISSHTRPVECIDGKATSADSAILYTADTMGVIKVWKLTRESGASSRWKSTLIEELNHHRTRINELVFGNGELWTASSDDTVQVLFDPSISSTQKTYPISIVHPTAVRAVLPLSLSVLGEPYLITGAGDFLRIYDVSSPEEPELIGEVDAHWHDVTAIRLWIRKTTGNDGKTQVEPWIVTTSLDSTIRKWKLSELLHPTPVTASVADIKNTPSVQSIANNDIDSRFKLTEEEERELDELLDSD